MKKALVNGKIYRGKGRFAEALLIQDDTITAAGSTEEISRRGAPETEIIDLRGKTMLPGFFDCHIHLNGIGRLAQSFDARGVKSPEELIERGRELILRLNPPAGAMIAGRGFDQNLFIGEQRYPTRYDLDKISRNHRISVSRVCGHVVVCNSAMLEMVGIADSAPPIEGGFIDTDENGKPLGILRENAASLVRRLAPPPTEEELQAMLEYAMGEALSVGLTSVASFDVMGPNFEAVVKAYRTIYREKGASLRVSLQCGIMGDDRLLDAMIARPWRSGDFIMEPYLKMGPLKLFADGSLGSHTALVRKPYRDNPGVKGMAAAEQPVLAAWIRKAQENGLQTATHAIGDGALEGVIKAILAIGEPGNPLRHGALHCQITDYPLLKMMAKSGLLALVQPIFLAHDAVMVESRVGPELASTSYAWKTMEKLGINVAYGTDAPVEAPAPLHGVACALLRRNIYEDLYGKSFYPEEGVDIFTAIDAYTQGSAYANFDENRLGRLDPGCLADCIMLDRDIFTIPPEEIPSIKILATVVGGKTVYGNLDS